MNNTHTPEMWEQTLDDEFAYYPHEPLYGLENQDNRRKLKSFIRQELSREYRRGRIQGHIDAVNILRNEPNQLDVGGAKYLNREWCINELQQLE